MRPFRKLVVTSALLYVASQAFFLVHIQYPRGYDFDELHYVPAARQWLALRENQNWEHPPLAKQIIALGIAALGDRPIGWRFMSTVFGALTLVGMYLWGWAVFRNQRAALLVALISLANQLLYVQARIGMLDTFMFAFMVFGLASFCRSWDPQVAPHRSRQLLTFSGLMFGLGAACKWTAVVAWLLCLGLIVLVKVRARLGFAGDRAPPRLKRQRRALPPRPPPGDRWYDPRLFAAIRPRDLALAFGLVPLAAYFLPFIPLLFIHRTPAYTLLDLVRLQPLMFAGQEHVTRAEPYMSDWTTWPLMLRPTWYAFEKDGAQSVRGVLFLGNPLVMWGGLLALGACAWEWLKRSSREAFLIIAVWAAFYFCWAVIPRKVTFFYYYYPAGMTLSLALTLVLEREDRPARIRIRGRAIELHWRSALFVAAAYGLFARFFAILAANKIPLQGFRQFMWFKRWL